MKIIVNGAPHDTTATTLAGLLNELGHGQSKIATAVNESFVAATLREKQALNTGDRVEIVAPRQGG
ncbi:sulfur carrier protein ThiS [Roseovarius sp.]|uniref:sulfur carrier protein ThiS n=1 Tax=Roseovarius sp. TaxID=1486281 RepID=UPI0026282DBF|nr:sulfur carrier protein ThiS [Roseovarius sp.]